MKLKITTLGLVIILLMVSTKVFALNAEDIDFGPSFQILDAQTREINIDEPILNTKELSFKLTLTNGLSHWVCWEEWNYNLKITKVGSSDDYNTKQSFDGEECLPPNTQKIVWIPFKSYNEMKEEQRIGKWRIEPSASIRNIECYESKDLIKESCRGSSSFSGNIKEFEVVKEEPTTHATYDNMLKWLKTGYNYAYAGFGFLLLLISVILGLKKLFGK